MPGRFAVRVAALVCFSALIYAKIPRPVANVIIQTPDRKNINLKNYRGKIVMLVLFLTDCDDCISTISLAGKLESTYGSRGFQVIGAAVNENAGYLVTPFIQRYRPNFPIGFLNKKEDIIRVLDLEPNVRPVAPLILFIDHLGNVRFQYSGRDKAVLNEMERNFPLIIGGLIKQRDDKLQPQRVNAPPK